MTAPIPTPRPLPPAEAAYYASQSPFSDPGRMAEPLYAGLPRDVGELARVVRNVLVHRVEGEQWGVPIDEQRMHHDAETRYMDGILGLLAERGTAGRSGGPLAAAGRHPRPYGERFVGVCRDFTLLHVSMLRHLGVPARLRVGFADYFGDGSDGDNGSDGFRFDHVVTEYWDEQRGWLLADPQIADPAHYAMDFDPVDVPRERFWSAGRAWRAVRAGEADPARFGLPPVGGELTGEWFVAGDVRLDLAALNKTETLLWDVWGASDELQPGTPVPEHLLPLFDRAAEAGAAVGTAANANADTDPYDAARTLFATSDGLRTPPTVTSYTRFTGTRRITLR